MSSVIPKNTAFHTVFAKKTERNMLMGIVFLYEGCYN